MIQEPVVIYSVDGVSGLRTQAKFLHWIDVQDAMGKTRGNTIPAIGAYKGQLEQSYISLMSDYKKFVMSSGYVDEQESVLVVNPEMTAYLADTKLQSLSLGLMRVREVLPEVALQAEGWTYRPDLGKYWVAE